jgi:hypothetical protein
MKRILVLAIAALMMSACAKTSSPESGSRASSLKDMSYSSKITALKAIPGVTWEDVNDYFGPYAYITAIDSVNWTYRYVQAATYGSCAEVSGQGTPDAGCELEIVFTMQNALAKSVVATAKVGGVAVGSSTVVIQ